MLAVLLMGVGASGASRAFAANSAWVSEGSGGNLIYQTTPRGDRVMDFSYAGYGGGGVDIPNVPSAIAVPPSGKEDAAAIQAAIDTVSKRPLEDGFRGAVTLQAGTYFCDAALAIHASGVVLRGAGDDEKTGTRIQMTGKAHGFLTVGPESSGSRRRESFISAVGPAAAIIDTYVPAGTQTLNVADASIFKPGDTVLISRPITSAWVHFMQMDQLVRNGKPETWLHSGDITMRRTITAIAGHRLTFDVPLSDDIDAAFLKSTNAATVQKYTAKEMLSHIGIERLAIFAPPIQIHMMTSPELAAQRAKTRDTTDEPAAPTRAFAGLHLDAVTDAWVRDIRITDTVGVLSIGPEASRITVQDIAAQHTVASVGAAKPADLVVQGSQLLLQRCTDAGDNVFYFVTQARVTGPIVLRDCRFTGNGHIAPHQRWATGLLVENCTVPSGGIDFMDRGVMGSGHGWTTGWSVAWNCDAKSFQIDQPPGVMNWAIGCIGDIHPSKEPGSDREVPAALYESHGHHVAPASLYEAQLKDRLGPAALHALKKETPA
jgi:hypothetical protein